MMQSEENSDQLINPGEWLNLSLGKNPSQESKSDQPESRVKILSFKSDQSESRVKIYSCNFCMRKFFSSQALGGHQNAHKRERGVIKHYNSDKMMNVMNLPVQASIFRSLGVQQHSLIHKQNYMARYKDSNITFGAIDEASHLMWPNSLRYYSQQQEHQSSSSNHLDLNLKL